MIVLFGVGRIHDGILLFAEDSDFDVHTNPRGRSQVGRLDSQKFFGEIWVRMETDPGATRADPGSCSGCGGTTVEARPSKDLANFQLRAEVLGWEENSTPGTFRPQIPVVEIDME